MKNCIVAQSGGPTAVINSSLAGVISAVLQNADIDKVYGAVNGIQGVLKESFELLNDTFKNSDGSINAENISLLKNTPAMYLGSCRYKLNKEKAAEEFEKIFEIFEKYNIGYFFYIGGNDSMDTVKQLSEYAAATGIDIKIMGVPKTIDNDLCFTDHTPGFCSAAKYIATSVKEIAFDTYIYDTESINIVEIMGRNAGWLTASAVLARGDGSVAPHLIYLPERVFDDERFISDIKEKLKETKQLVIAVSEGIRRADGSYVSADGTNKDQFGHVMLSGTGKYLERLVADRLGCKVRSVELNVLQRGAAHCTSETDVEEAFRLGEVAANAARAGETGKMSVITRICNSPYMTEYSTCLIENVANLEKKVPDEWINEAGNDVTEDMIKYLRPLVKGEPERKLENGIPVFLNRK